MLDTGSFPNGLMSRREVPVPATVAAVLLNLLAAGLFGLVAALGGALQRGLALAVLGLRAFAVMAGAGRAARAWAASPPPGCQPVRPRA
jgi:hypothetical protein